MASSLLDELPCLLDEAAELLARVSFHMQVLLSSAGDSMALADALSPPQQPEDDDAAPTVHQLRQRLCGVDVDALLRAFSKHSFGMSSSMAADKQLQALLPVSAVQRQALQTLVAKAFQLLKRVHQWQQTTWGVLTPFFVDSSHLTFDKHRLLTTLLLSALAQSVKLHLVCTSFPNVSGIVALHTFLQSSLPAAADSQEPQRDLDSPESRLLEFVLSVGTNPLIKIQQDLQQHPQATDISRNLLELLLSCFDCYVGCHDLAHLKNSGVFDIETLHRGEYAGAAVFSDLAMAPSLAEWVLCVALCLPQHWKTAAPRHASWQLWDFVELIARDRLVWIVARDHTVNLHDLLYQQLQSALAGAPSTAAIQALQPLKKALHTLSKQAVRCAAERRGERRVFVLWLLRDCVKLLEHRAKLASPLLPILLSVLAVASDEIEWMLAHGRVHSSAAALAPGHVKQKHFAKVQASYSLDQPALLEILTLTWRLRKLVASQQPSIIAYYMQFLANGDADAIAFHVADFLDSDDAALGMSLDPRLAEMLRGLGDKSRFQIAATNPAFASWRREWQQLSIFLLMSGRGLPKTLSSLINRACRHANYVQGLELVLDKATTGLSKCWWFAGLVERTLTHRLEHSSGIRVGDAISASFVLAELRDGHIPVLELVETEEAERLASEMDMRLTRLTDAFIRALERWLSRCISEELVLHSKLRPDDLIDRMGPTKSMTISERLNASPSPSSPAVLNLLTPGTESRLKTTPDDAMRTLDALQEAQDSLSALTRALRLYVLEDKSRHGFAGFRHGLTRCIERLARQTLRDAVKCGDAEVSQSSWEVVNRRWRCVVRLLLATFGGESYRQHFDVRSVISTVAHDECRLSGSNLQAMATSVTVIQATRPNPFPEDWRLLDRLGWYFVRIIETKCVPSSNAPKFPVYIASWMKKSLWAIDSSDQLHPEETASSNSIRYLHDLVGDDAMRKICDVLMGYVVQQLTLLYELLERDKVALIRLRLAFPDDESEIQMAVKIMETLDQFVERSVRIGVALFLAQILGDSIQLDTSDRVSLFQRHWKDTSAAQSKATWSLLQWAFVATMHARVWDRPVRYHAELDAVDGNLHLIATAVEFTLRTVVWDRRACVSSEERREQVRQVAHAVSQAALRIRMNATRRRSSAIVLVVAKHFLDRLSTPHNDHEAAAGVHVHLPDALVRSALTQCG
ncbi:hypothetical protein PINS_up004897 [Pythium insidiosum]|nr:hypothetical protein PINS_up004897 [Pythium insidiosum]